MLTGVSPRRLPAPTATDTTPQPLWKKPSFPFVALIALTTLPFDLAAARQSSTPPRHAKPTPAGTARPAPTQDIAAVKQQAAVAAAAAGQGNSSAASSAAAAGTGAGPAVDSWDAAGGDVSNEDAEQQAKAMVIALLTHPKVLRFWDGSAAVQQFLHPHVCASMSECWVPLCTHALQDTEAALMRAAAAGKGGGDGGAEGAGLSVSPEYIDALVQAAREPTMGEKKGIGSGCGCVVLILRSC